MTNAWRLLTRRDDISETRLEEMPVPTAGEGEVVLRLNRIGLSANNITYAALGDSFRYWQFFPAEDPWGIVPVWGFADVVESQVPGVEVGQRYYGYYPSASHLVARPGRVDERGFAEVSPHRVELPSPYNTYALTSTDRAYDEAQEDLLALYRPLFWTSWLLADWLAAGGAECATSVVMSSASSKTAYGTAHCLAGSGLRRVGLTSGRNRDFTQSLGCYDEVLAYDQVSELDPASPSVYCDFSGDADHLTALDDHLGDSLRKAVVVGITAQNERPVAGLPTRTSKGLFFAPDQMRKRIADWGLDGLDERFAEGWRSFAADSDLFVELSEQSGPEALQAVWQEVQSGQSDPRTGHILTF
ncbi:MAG: DUF2855 family protein [Micrococcales bacterium]|nr:DUF2855 family protein [Micrococcales bacterium]